MMNMATWTKWVEGELVNADLHFGHGTDNARDEAAWLVLHVAGVSLDGSFDDWGRQLDESEEIQLQQLLEARISQKIPLAYLTGAARFAGLEFESGRAALVPRSPIAELVLDGFEPWLEPGRACRVLDMCTGSGCIAIALAKYRSCTTVDAVDVSREALEIAARNVERHAVADRVNLIESDLFHSLPARRYDLIVANPPYIPVESVHDLPGEYRAEPVLGLASGADGLDATLAILLDAPRYLSANSVLVCEVGESEERLLTLLPDTAFLWLEFERGGSGVFILERDELERSRPQLIALNKERRNVA